MRAGINLLMQMQWPKILLLRPVSYSNLSARMEKVVKKGNYAQKINMLSGKVRFLNFY